MVLCFPQSLAAVYGLRVLAPYSKYSLQNSGCNFSFKGEIFGETNHFECATALTVILAKHFLIEFFFHNKSSLWSIRVQKFLNRLSGQSDVPLSQPLGTKNRIFSVIISAVTKESHNGVAGTKYLGHPQGSNNIEAT
jgi:hypothetical protein